ncbi:drebrin [Brachionichthys hirsutus]|uniref:drebrin n=1 Tax=Brachionichthys hirsutus TaxID=412623 RepID=UPI00360536A2
MDPGLESVSVQDLKLNASGPRRREEEEQEEEEEEEEEEQEQEEEEQRLCRLWFGAGARLWFGAGARPGFGAGARPGFAEPSLEDLNLDRKESEVDEAKAIIAQRSGNPREFFKQKERAMTVSEEAPPVSVHRTGRLDSPFLRQHHIPSSPSSTPPRRGPSPLGAAPHSRTQLATTAGNDDDEARTERNMATVSPIPKIVTTPIKEDFSKDRWGQSGDSDPKPEQVPTVREAAPPKPVQSVAPQARDCFSVWESGTDSLVNLWDSSSCPSAGLVDPLDDVPPSAAAASSKPQPLLSFEEMMDGTFCSGAEDDPSALVDASASDQMTLSYQHALQHAAGEMRELDDGRLLMTNGETLLKEGAQASEGYFSQSQEEEFGQSEETSAKPGPVLYNKPPEIDITCWDTDPVADDDDE